MKPGRTAVWVVAGLATGLSGCGHDLSPRLLDAAEGFRVETPGPWERAEFPAPDIAGVRRIVYTAGHGAGQFLVVVDQYSGRAPTLDEARGGPEFDSADQIQRGRYRGYEFLDARVPHQMITTATGATAFVRLVVTPTETIELQYRRSGDDVATPDPRWAGFRDSLELKTP